MLTTLVGTELAKLRRTRVPWLTLAGMLAGPLAIGLFMWILQEPDRAAQLGLMGQKAELSGIEAAWPSLASFLVVIVGAGGVLFLAFIVAFVFGREYADGTARLMLALPVPRARFALAKLAAVALWWAALVLVVPVEGLVIGAVLRLPGWTLALGLRTLGDLAVAAVVAFLLAPAVAWAAVWSRSYLGAIGFALATLMLGNVFGHTGWALWFPWSIPTLLAGTLGAPVPSLPAGSWVVLGVTFVVGVVGTAAHLVRADVVD